MFGGNVASKESDELHVFDFLTSTWSRVHFTNGPPARYGHAACVLGENMIIVGGCKQSNAYWKDSWSYNFSKCINRDEDMCCVVVQRLN